MEVLFMTLIIGSLVYLGLWHLRNHRATAEELIRRHASGLVDDPTNEQARRELADRYRSARRWHDLHEVLRDELRHPGVWPERRREVTDELVDLAVRHLRRDDWEMQARELQLAERPGDMALYTAARERYEAIGDWTGALRIVERQVDAAPPGDRHGLLLLAASICERRLADFGRAEQFRARSAAPAAG
jgi:hypothetical protein